MTTLCVYIIPKKGNKPTNIKINNTSIETGEHGEKDIDKCVKFLGFKIDYELSFKHQNKEIINRITKGTYALATRKYTLPKTKLMIYHSNSLSLTKWTKLWC